MSRSKAKGTAYETEIVNYLNENGFNVERRALTGKNDKGDIAGVQNWVLEAKNHKELKFAQFVDEAMVERDNADVDFAAAIVKRRYKNVADSYVVMPLHQLVEIIRGLEC